MAKNNKKIIVVIVIITILGVIIGILTRMSIDINENFIINENGMKYANNIIVIFFNSDVNESTCNQIAKEINVNIISLNSVSARVQLKDRKFTSYDEILQYCQQVENQYEEVKYVMPEMIETTTVN